MERETAPNGPGSLWDVTDRPESELKELMVPLMEWLKNNCHPHVTAIVDSEKGTLVEGVISIPRVEHQPGE